MTPRSDIVAAVLLGIATFSKPTNILLIGPVLVLLAWRRQWRRAFTTGAVFGAVVGGLFAWNVAITGEWNYQGGEDRGTFYSMDPDGPGPRIGGFPFQTAQHSFDTTGMIRETNRVPVEVLATGDALLQVFPQKRRVFLLRSPHRFRAVLLSGRRGHSAVLVRRQATAAMAVVDAGRRPRLGDGLDSRTCRYSYSGGGGPVGNRYFLGVYPVFLYVVPPLTGLTAPIVAVLGGAIFTAQLVTNPFTVSFRPAEHVKSGPYRWLPAEMTLLNDLPMNVTPAEGQAATGRGAAGVGLLP